MSPDRTQPAPPRALDRPPPGDLLLITLAVVAVSTSAPLIRYAAAPALAVAFWRNAMASGVLVPWALLRSRDELRATTPRDKRLSVYAGLLLAGHFATWIPSLSFTSVASSVALVAVQPVWAALIARRQGERIPAAGWTGIWISVVGAVLLSGIDLSISPRALFGDLLAIVGGLLAAAYMSVGAEARRTVSTTAYTAICYPVAALVLLAVSLAARQPVAGYDGRTWLCLVGLTVGPQLLGHSVFNRVLRTTSATIVSISILFEIVGASLIAVLPPIRETPPLAALPAAALIAFGVVVVVRAGDRAAPVVE